MSNEIGKILSDADLYKIIKDFTPEQKKILTIYAMAAKDINRAYELDNKGAHHR